MLTTLCYIDDIAGAQSRGLASVYIAGGIDAESHGLKPSAHETTMGPWQLQDEIWEQIVSASAPEIGVPTFVMPYFQW